MNLETGSPTPETQGKTAIVKIAIQLYSLRDRLESEPDKALGELAEIGYNHVELAGTYGLEPAEYKALLDKHGLQATSSHMGPQDILNDTEKAADFAKLFGMSYLAVPWVDKNNVPGGSWVGLADLLNEAAEALAPHGIRLGYHNHDFELAETDGAVPLDLLIQHVDPKLVFFELDLCWVAAGGADPAAYIQAVEKTPLLHFKDWSGEAIADLGEGILNWDQLIELGKGADTKFAIVENDNPTDSMEFARKAFNFLKSKGLEA
jgi:sugar phosphate isomerase/epimerase